MIQDLCSPLIMQLVKPIVGAEDAEDGNVLLEDGSRVLTEDSGFVLTED